MTIGESADTSSDARSARSSSSSHVSDRNSGTIAAYAARVPASPPGCDYRPGVTSTGPKEATFPTALVPFATRVERRIDDLLARELARWRTVDAGLAEPIEALRGFVATGGKRLRPAFCYCAFVGACGDTDDPRVVDAAAALELVHTFALAHDDVMDGSEMRRGNDSVHARFARRHVRAGWRGEPRRFGEGMAILVGDFAFTYADVLMRGMPEAAHVVFDELRVELCVGQSLDLAGTATASTEADLANRIAVYKSGKYTVERPLRSGLPSPRSACRSGTRSSSATMCSARSATRRSRASRSVTTCARANPRRSSRSRTHERMPPTGN